MPNSYHFGAAASGRLRLLPAFAIFVTLFAGQQTPGYAQSIFTISGFVKNAQNDQTIPGATIYVSSHDVGTYSLSDGSFRISVSSLPAVIDVSSLGYVKQRGISITSESDINTIALQPTDIKMGEVIVTAEPTPEEIVRRAIQRKDANQERLKTFKAELYSKLSFEIEGNVFGEIEDKDRNQLRESFSTVMRDNEADVTHISIEKRRQTANITPDNNLLAITNFYSFYEERFRISNAVITTPLASDALDSYEFTLNKRTMLDDQVAWTLDFKPYSDVFPGFVGSMTIVSGTYDLIEVRAEPSAGTAIRYIDDVKFHQKFEEVADSIWAPTFLNSSGSGSVTVIAGIAEVGGRLSATSFYRDIVVNKPLPDSIYKQETIFSVSPLADSSAAEFWERSSPAQLTDRETRMYAKVDSLVREANIAAGNPIDGATFRYNYSPEFVFNRVAGAAPGLEFRMFYDPLRFDGEGFYAFGTEEFYGNARLSSRVLDWEHGNLWAAASVFAELATQPHGRSFFREANTVLAALFSQDHYDYFERHGWSAGLTLRHDRINFYTGFSQERHFSTARTSESGLFKSAFAPNEDGIFRANPAVAEGQFNIIRSVATWGNYDVNLSISTSTRFDVTAQLEALYAEADATGDRFRVLRGGVRSTIPTFSSGYVPMTLELALKGGIADDETPIQHQFVMPTRLRVFGRADQFITGGPGFFGGTEYVALYARHNFTDLWWRAIGLPTFEGRGLDVSLFVNSGIFEQNAPLNLESGFYTGTGSNGHTEVGFGIGKIPIFISNVFFLGFDAGWSVESPIGNDFGWSVTLSSPF